jgi:hypothetical protein
MNQMSSMVDRRSETDVEGITRNGDGGAFVLLMKSRFVVAGAAAVAAVVLGFFAEEPRDVVPGKARVLRLDPNTVPPGVLTALPHVGPSLVNRWVTAREERPFRSLEDARSRVRGLGKATLGQIAPYLVFPEGAEFDATQPTEGITDRRGAKGRAGRRQQPASGRANVNGQPRLTASLAPSGDR